MLSSHSMLCPCVINPEDNSNELKKLVYFNKMYQVRRVAFVTACSPLGDQGTTEGLIFGDGGQFPLILMTY